MSQESSPPPAQSVFVALGRLQDILAEVAGLDCWSLSDADVEAVLAEVAVAQSRLAAVRLAGVAEADARSLGVADATSTAGWLRARLLLGPAEAKATVRLATALRADCPDTGAALGGGQLSTAHARFIVKAMVGLPDGVDPATRVRAEGFLIGQSAVLDPMVLGRAAQALIEALSTEPSRGEKIVADIARREFTAVPAYDGMIRLSGWFDREAWAEIAAVLDPLAAPAAEAPGIRMGPAGVVPTGSSRWRAPPRRPRRGGPGCCAPRSTSPSDTHP